MSTVLYRIGSGEVIKISVKNQTFAERNTKYWGVLTDPQISDSVEVLDTNQNKRVLGFAKIWDGVNVRNATQTEIDNFVVAEDTDDKLQDKDRAVDLLQTQPQFRKLFTAFADIIRQEINILRAQHNLPDRTLVQFKNAVRNRLSEND